MPAYSFGARWVGIVSMRESPALVPEPLHTMAQRLRQNNVERPIRISREVSLPAGTVLHRLGRARARFVRAGNKARAAECLQVETALRRGAQPRIRPWLAAELTKDRKQRTRTQSGQLKSNRQPKDGPRPVTPKTHVKRIETQPRLHAPGPPPVEIRDTGWADSFPIAPTSPLLPPVSESLLRAFQDAGILLDDEALGWIRWAMVHKSHLYESINDGPVSSGGLELLQMVGAAWLRLAILESARSTRGEFASNNDVSQILAQDSAARSAVTTWLMAAGAPLYGRGEAALLQSGRGSRAPEAVAQQVIGALALTSASVVPASALLTAAGFVVADPEPDWRALVRKATGAVPAEEISTFGPDHARTFEAVITVGKRSAAGRGQSRKEARRAALKEWVLQYAGSSILAASVAAPNAPEPKALQTSTAHRSVVAWAGNAFGARVPELYSQALIHRSWAFENKPVIARSSQRDYGVLATEGAEVLRMLVVHQYALKVLSADPAINKVDVIGPSVTAVRTAELYDVCNLDSGVLRSPGLTPSVEMKSDVVQALAAAAWRGAPGGLARRQYSDLAEWVQSFVARRDTTTALQEYGAVQQISFEYQFEARGPDHVREYRATVQIEGDASAAVQGGWSPGKTPAKHSASGLVLRLLTGDDIDSLTSSESAMLRACLLAELRVADPEKPEAERDRLTGRLKLDSLVAGDFEAFELWATPRSLVLADNHASVLQRAQDYYRAEILQLRRERIAGILHQLLPRLRDDERADALRGWASTDAPGVLALLEAFLSDMGRQQDPIEAVLSFIQVQTRIIAAHARTESETVITTHPDSTSIAVRVTGVDIESAAAPLVDVVGSLVETASWAFEMDHFSVTLPRIPESSVPLANAGYAALASTTRDPWQATIHRNLEALLGAAERGDHDTAAEAVLSTQAYLRDM